MISTFELAGVIDSHVNRCMGGARVDWFNIQREVIKPGLDSGLEWNLEYGIRGLMA